jgi:hypothetical protein
VWADSVAAQGRLSAVVRARLGADGYQKMYGEPMRPQPTAEEAAKRDEALLAGANVEVAGDQARITPAAAGAKDRPIWLVRQEGRWWVWIGAVVRARDPDLLENYLRNNWHYGRVYDRVASAVESGSITTAEKANEALAFFEDQEMRKAGPASRPAMITVEQAKEEDQKMIERERRRARLEREAAAGPLVEPKPR